MYKRGPRKRAIDGNNVRKPNVNSNGDAGDYIDNNKLFHKKKVLVYRMDGYLLSLFVNELKVSKIYRQSLLKKLQHFKKEYNLNLKLKIDLVPAKHDIIDYSWNEKLTKLCFERRELDYTMSWLSTLGGAFSALGDHYINCAQIAGKISVHQFKLALRIGDPLTVARCKLYLSLSLVQLGKFKLAQKIILEQYCIAKNNQIIDYRLINMCKGIWAKLKYEKSIYKQGKLTKKKKNPKLKIKNS